MFMYPLRKLSAHDGRIRTVQLALAVQRGWNHCLAVMASDHNNPKWNSVEH